MWRWAGGVSVGVGGYSYYRREEEDIKSSVLGLIRAARAITCWVKLVSFYKYTAKRMEEGGDVEGMKRAAHTYGAELVLDLCRRNGGMFIKIGQHASSLKPAIPDE